MSSRQPIRVTAAMVEACAATMVDQDWLSEHWASKKEKCNGCGQTIYNTDGDGGREVRRAIRMFLTAALKAADR